MKHEKGFGCFSWFPRVGCIKRGSGVSHGSQEWGGKGLGRQKMKHEKTTTKREHTLSSLSSMPGEVPFCKKTS